MFGKNEQIKHIENSNGALLVREIFSTIQGEGPFTGTPATFVRLGGCNLKCHFCDTDFDHTLSTMLPVSEVVEQCARNAHSLVVITGGEPLLQDIAPLVRSLRKLGIRCQVETAGTVWPETLTDAVDPSGNLPLSIIVSPKTKKIHPEVRRYATAYKYLVRTSYGFDSEADVPICNTQEEFGKVNSLAEPSIFKEVFLQPVEEYHPDGRAWPEQTTKNIERAVELCMRYDYRLSLQIHKILRMP